MNTIDLKAVFGLNNPVWPRDRQLVNNIEFDHADIYRDLADIERVFAQVVNTVPADGLVLANGDDPVVARLLPRAPAEVQTYGMGPRNHWRATGIEAAGLSQTFSVLEADRERRRLRLPNQDRRPGDGRNAHQHHGVRQPASVSHSAMLAEGVGMPHLAPLPARRLECPRRQGTLAQRRSPL